MFSRICLEDKMSDSVVNAVVHSRELCTEPATYRDIPEELAERRDEGHGCGGYRCGVCSHSCPSEGIPARRARRARC